MVVVKLSRAFKLLRYLQSIFTLNFNETWVLKYNQNYAFKNQNLPIFQLKANSSLKLTEKFHWFNNKSTIGWLLSKLSIFCRRLVGVVKFHFQALKRHFANGAKVARNISILTIQIAGGKQIGRVTAKAQFSPNKNAMPQLLRHVSLFTHRKDCLSVLFKYCYFPLFSNPCKYVVGKQVI